MSQKGYPTSSIEATGRRLRWLAKNCNLNDSVAVNTCIAAHKVADSYKRNLARAYSYYVKVNSLTWEKPRYQPVKRMPKVPTTEAVNKIISRASWRYATVFSVLRDTGMMPEELHKTALRDIDLERGTINAPGLKGHLPRTLKLQGSTLAMLKRYLTETQKEYPFPTWKQMYEAWRRFRNDLTKKLSDPSLKTIRLYDLRHYFGTMLYHKTKDILYTKQQMGHQKIETTLIYAQLINFGEDEWTARTAKTLEEATKLIEAGFEYVTDMDSVKIFKKRK